jgi:hypothetical protein
VIRARRRCYSGCVTKPSERDPAEFADDTDEDTVELELSPEQSLALSRAAEEAQAAANPVESTPEPASPASLSVLEAPQAHRTARWDNGMSSRMMRVAGVLATVVALAIWAAAHRAAEPHSSAPTATIDVPVSTAPAGTVPADPERSPVRFTNPFDASEVFEFPPGTSETEARQAVAELLRQRARDRWAQAGPLKQRDGGQVAAGRRREGAG